MRPEPAILSQFSWCPGCRGVVPNFETRSGMKNLKGATNRSLYITIEKKKQGKNNSIRISQFISRKVLDEVRNSQSLDSLIMRLFKQEPPLHSIPWPDCNVRSVRSAETAITIVIGSAALTHGIWISAGWGFIRILGKIGLRTVCTVRSIRQLTDAELFGWSLEQTRAHALGINSEHPL